MSGRRWGGIHGWLALTALLAVLGCHAAAPHGSWREALPTYEPMSGAEVLTVMAERAKGVRTLQARGRVILTSSEASSVELEGVMVLRPPDELRLRAWKMSTPVFDLTLRPEGLWVFAADRGGEAGLQEWTEQLTARHVRFWCQALLGAFPTEAWEAAGRTEDPVLRIRPRDAGDAVEISCEVERRHLTLNGCTVRDERNPEVRVIRFGDYRVLNGTVLPAYAEFVSPEGTLVLLHDEVQVNEPPAARAFNPPRRAVKR